MPSNLPVIFKACGFRDIVSTEAHHIKTEYTMWKKSFVGTGHAGKTATHTEMAEINK